jgi:hypothetical protein
MVFKNVRATLPVSLLPSRLKGASGSLKDGVDEHLNKVCFSYFFYSTYVYYS